MSEKRAPVRLPIARVALVRDRNENRAFLSRAIYGLVTVLAVLQALELHPPTAWVAVITVFGTTVAVAMVEIYADAVAGMISNQRRLSRHDLRHILGEAAPVLTGAQAPTVILLLVALGLIPV